MRRPTTSKGLEMPLKLLLDLLTGNMALVNIPAVAVVLARLSEASDYRVTEASDYRISEDQ